MGTLAANADDVLILLLALAALTVAWWGAAIWWTVRRSNWRYGVLAGAVCWALLPPAGVWCAIKLASRNMVNER